MTGLLDHYAARKRKWQVSSDGESDTTPAQTMGHSQPAVDGCSGDQAIIIPCSPKLGPIDQMKPSGVSRMESKKADQAPSALQIIPPSDRAKDQPGRSKFMRSGLPRPTLPDRIITYSYLPPRRL